MIPMAIMIPVEMYPIPDGATEQDRLDMFNEYKRRLAKANPHLMNPDGTQKSLWQSIKRLFNKR